MPLNTEEEVVQFVQETLAYVGGFNPDDISGLRRMLGNGVSAPGGHLHSLCYWIVLMTWLTLAQNFPSNTVTVHRVWSFFGWRPNRADIDFLVSGADLGPTTRVKVVSWRLSGPTEIYQYDCYRAEGMVKLNDHTIMYGPFTQGGPTRIRTLGGNV